MMPRASLEIAALDEVERCVEHERDTRERLHRPVVKEQRDAAPLVLLGGENLLRLVGHAVSLSR